MSYRLTLLTLEVLLLKNMEVKWWEQNPELKEVFRIYAITNYVMKYVFYSFVCPSVFLCTIGIYIHSVVDWWSDWQLLRHRLNKTSFYCMDKNWILLNMFMITSSFSLYFSFHVLSTHLVDKLCIIVPQLWNRQFTRSCSYCNFQRLSYKPTTHDYFWHNNAAKFPCILFVGILRFGQFEYFRHELIIRVTKIMLQGPSSLYSSSPCGSGYFLPFSWRKTIFTDMMLALTADAVWMAAMLRNVRCHKTTRK